MSDGIEAVISSSIASLPGSDASSGAGSGSSSSSAAVADTPAVDSGSGGDTPHSDTPISDGDAAAGSTDGAVAPGAAPVAPAETPVAAVAAVPADDSLDTLKTELAGKRDNRIPYSRVQRIVENAEKKAVAAVEARYEAEVAPYRTVEFQNGQAAMTLADKAPDQFLAALAQADPRYAELLAGSKALSGRQEPARGAVSDVPDGEVEPDIQLADGTLGFSAEATKAREAQLRKQLNDEFRAILKEEMKGVEPLVSRERQNKMRGEAADRVGQRIAEAQKKWPGFAGLQDEMGALVTAATKRGERLDLHEAYIQAYTSKYRSDEATVRARVVAEMNSAAGAASRTAPSVSKPAAAGAAKSDVDPLTAAIQESIAALKR
jgi:hypothetical protein